MAIQWWPGTPDPFEGPKAEKVTPTNYLEAGTQALGNWYQQYLGRSGDYETEYLPHLRAAGYRDDPYAEFNYAPLEWSIRESDEAKQFASRPPTPPPPPEPPIQVDPVDRDTDMTPKAPAAPQAPANWETWFYQQVGGRAPHPNELTGLEQEFGRYGVKVLRNAAGMADKIQLPDGTVIDVIQGATPTGGVRWQWLIEGPGGGGGGLPSGGPAPNTGIPGFDLPSYIAQYGDEATKYLEALVQRRIQELNQSVNDPARQALAELLQQQTALYRQQQTQNAAEAQRLSAARGQAGTEAERLMALLQERMGRLGSVPSSVTAAYQTQADALRGLAQTFQTLPPEVQAAFAELEAATRKRVTELQAPAYTGPELEILRTQALEPIERDRAAAQRRATARISQSGALDSSGIALDLQQQVDRAFDEERARAQGELGYRQVTERRSREQEALALLEALTSQQEGQAASRESRQLTGAQLLAAITSGEREQLDLQSDREQEAIALQQLRAAIPLLVAQGDLGFLQSLNAFVAQPGTGALTTQNLLADLAQRTRSEEAARRGEGISLASMLADLPSQRLQDALATLGIGPSASGVTGSALSLLQNTQGQRALDQSNSAAYWYQLAQAFL